MKLSIANAARYAALLAAMAISYSMERDLALTHGVPPAVSWAVPVAIDLFMVWAVRVGRDVALSVSVALSANVAGVLTTQPLHSVNTWASAALHAVFPFIVYRMHRTARHASAEPSGVTAGARTPDDSADGPHGGAVAVSDDTWRAFDAAAKSPAPAEPVRPDVSALREAVRALSADGRVTGKAMAEHFGVSERTGRRYLAMAAA